MKINHREVLRRLVKYLILTLLVAYSAKIIIKSRVSGVEAFYWYSQHQQYLLY